MFPKAKDENTQKYNMQKETRPANSLLSDECVPRTSH